MGVSVWAAGEVGLWWTRAAPDETQPATRAKRAETDKSDGAPKMSQSRSFKAKKSGSVPADLAEPRLGPRPSPNPPRFLPDTLTHPLFGVDGDFRRLKDHDQPTINSSLACWTRRHTLCSQCPPPWPPPASSVTICDWQSCPARHTPTPRFPSRVDDSNSP